MSIRFRLTLLYSTLLAIVLTFFSVVLFAAVAFRLNNDLDRELDTRRDQVESAIQDAVRREPLLFLRTGRINVQQSIDIFAAPGIFVQVLRAGDAQVVGASENLGSQTLPHGDDVLAPARSGESAYSIFTTDNRVRYRVLTAPISLGGRVIGITQVAASLQGIERTLNLLALLLAVGTFSAVGVSALIGYLLAGRALKPIDDITRAAHAIAQTRDLEQRVRETHNSDELDRLAITFNEMLQRLDRLFRTQQRFLADVSHELRTPLTIIRGNLSLLHKTSAPEEQVVVKTIDDEAGRMQRLIGDLLLLAQSDAGVINMQRQPVEIDTLLLDVYRQARVMAQSRNGQLKITLGNEDQALVEGDPDRLKQLLLNLTENAIKYTRSGEIKLSLLKQNSMVGVSVSDSGVGIPAEDLPHIFERFYRVDKARGRAAPTSAGSGTGLGLSIADWIARSHGGYIEVQSEIGKGSTFTVWLPERL